MREPPPIDIDIAEYAALRDAGQPHLLLDVREPWEVAVATIEGSLSMPMSELADRAGTLPEDRDIVVMCHHGGRSLAATRWLRARGLGNARNLVGGIDAWAREIDPSVARY